MHYKNKHRFSQTGLDRDSEHFQHTCITHLTHLTSFHTNTWFPFTTSFQYFLSHNSITYYTTLPDSAPAMILAHRHTLFYDYELSALSIWNLLMQTSFCSVPFTLLTVAPKVPKGLMPDNSLALAPSCLVKSPELLLSLHHGSAFSLLLAGL